MATIYDAMQEHVKQCNWKYKDDVYGIYGKRCSEIIQLFYDKKDKIFHRQFKVKPSCSYSGLHLTAKK